MIYKILWTESKNNDWVVTNLEGVDGTKAENVSINRTNKKGEVFPNFDEIQSGREVEGELWRSDAGKFYLFAPKKISQFVPKKGNVAALMEKKQIGIEKSQDRKEDSIQKAGSQRDATLMVTTFYKDKEWDDNELQQLIRQWYRFFIGLSDEPFV